GAAPNGIPAGMTLGNGCDPTDNFGWKIGQDYDLKWPQNANVGILPSDVPTVLNLGNGTDKVPCQGDNEQQWINMGVGDQNHDGAIDLSGYGGCSGASCVVSEIQDDQRTLNLGLGSYLNPPQGEKNTVVSNFS